MPTINTNPASGSEAQTNPSSPKPQSPFPFSPDSYCLPKSITSPSNPESPLLPTNSPTFLVSGSDCKPAFKVPTSPISKDTRDGINSYVEWVEGQDEEDENEGLIMFPSYHNSHSPLSEKKMGPFEKEDLELLAAEFSDDSYSSESNASETETDSNASSRSSSPSLEGEEFDCDASLCETWSNTSCTTPPPTAPPFIFAEDDISLHSSSQPAHCVDYLAHEWKTDDLWTSYKHVHSHREGIRASKRLENALWRVWWRDNQGLKRIGPDAIHWLKDSDITWLYGPFQPASSKVPSLLSDPTAETQIQLQSQIQPPSITSPTKSLLKKHNPAKILQQRSEYTFSLLREATGFRIPSPSPSPVLEPQSKFLRLDVDEFGLKKKERTGRRVVFNEIVILYREVVEDEEDSSDDEYFRDFDDDFDGVD